MEHYGHPLLISKIIQNILAFFPADELLRNRRVCRLWNEESCIIFQSIRTVSFSNASEVSIYVETFTPNTAFTSLLPFLHSRFHFQKIKMNLIFDNYVVRKFFKIFGPQIRDLHLNLHGRLFRMKFLRLGILENLHHLDTVRITFKDMHELWPGAMNDDHEILPLWTVTKLRVDGAKTHVSWKSPLTKILACLPNLQTIEADGNGLGNLVFEILLTDKNSAVPIPPLVHLDFDRISSQHIDSIISNGLPLRSLKAELDESVDQLRISSMLDFLAPTLEELEIGSTTLRFPEPTRVMRSLVKLEIQRFHCDLCIFGNKFPALRKLRFKLTDIVSGNMSGKFYKNLTMVSLTLEGCDRLKAFIPAFGNMFPYLRRLHVPTNGLEIGENILGLICDWMWNLEELYLADDGVNDTAVTGIPNRICKEVLERLQFGGGPPFDPLPFRDEKSGWIGCLRRKGGPRNSFPVITLIQAVDDSPTPPSLHYNIIRHP